MADWDAESGPGGVIRVRGARVHNLRDVRVDIPRDRLVVLTGVSGSGKSSLAFDTLYAEGRRRYLESLTSYARQFLDQLERPDVDAIEGLPPTVAIDQRSGAAGPRSTVGTITEVMDYLRVLFARAGTPHCPRCGLPIRRQTPEQMVDTVLAMREGRKVLILAPLARGRKGQNAEAFQAIRRAGLIRARVDGRVIEVTPDDPPLARTKAHNIEAVVDRLVVRDGIRPRLAESIDLGLKLGGGTILLSAQTEDGWADEPHSLHFACPSCGLGLQELEPRTFSFNSPHGACPRCDGLGTIAAEIEVRKSPLKKQKAAKDGGLDREKLGRPSGKGSDPPTPAREPPTAPCPECQGARLGPAARAVTIAGETLPALCALPVDEARRFFDRLEFSASQAAIGPPLVREVVARLSFLEEVGLAYLTLSRGADTLSGGELQRVRLATQIGSGLVGVCYILDEPTAGLHPADTRMLIASLVRLRDQGNSVIVVEHDEETIRGADWLVDLGPGAGPEGGLVVAQGPAGSLVEDGDSSTARYLRGEWTIPRPPSDRLARSPGRISVTDARARNLQGVDVEVPLGTLTCVTGASGSGKSTLVHQVIARAAAHTLGGRDGPISGEATVTGLGAIDKLIVIDQSPIGRGPRSTPSTFTGVYDEIRKVFARTREAKVRGYKASRFSFNVKGGRCEVCEGQGLRRVAMNFLPDLSVRCEACGGRRFNRQTLEVRFKGLSIGEVLGLRVDESRDVFEAQPKVRSGLDALHEAGLGYITLGQTSATLSGGEAQRVKLAAELGRPATGRTLYILDEPTTGLHFEDVARLLRVLHRLAEVGNTLLVIEHNLDVIKTADWVIDLGPHGGTQGGRLMATGPPEAIAAAESSLTGQFLKPKLEPSVHGRGSA